MLFTPTVLKNLIRKPATRNYPSEVREPFPNYRGELIIDIDSCIFCGTCSRKCPSQCITVTKPEATWECNPHACVYCGVCVDNCPTKCLSMKNVHRKPMTERITWIEKGTLPKPKKKASAPKAKDAAAKETAHPEKKSDAQATGNDSNPVTKKGGKKGSQKKS